MQLYWRHWKATRTREEDTLAFSVLASVKSGEEAILPTAASQKQFVGWMCETSQKTTAVNLWPKIDDFSGAQNIHSL